MRNKVFSLLLGILLILGSGIFLLPQKEASDTENRPLSQNASIRFSSLISDSEAVMKDQFYGRDFLLKNYYKIRVAFNKLFAQKEEYVYLSEDVVDVGDGYLIASLADYSQEELNRAADRGYNLNEVDLKYPDIRTYVYFPTRIEEKESILQDKGMLGAMNEAFIGQLNGDIRYDRLEYEGLEAYKERFFMSDFHWNIDGAYQGYCDIVNMIGQDFDIGEPKPIKEEVTYEYDFLGNVANKIGKNASPDHLRNYILEGVGEHSYTVNGEISDDTEAKESYRENGPKEGESDYDSFFAGYELIRVFDFKQEDKPNVLIFGDSYVNPIQTWLASHFNETVVVDLRSNDGSFSLEDVIREHDIDIILVCEMYYNLYINGNMFIPIN